ncbi:hypothetical protein [Nocardia wallacei]|uniref:hypothetical protein n=1 Tax=Nocardia wallacei TaxID=480035 RepID=UPI0024579DE7|nr:hypothetical protein [Nocardia wallacei]
MMNTIYHLGDTFTYDGCTWRVIGTQGIPGATQVVDLRDVADGRHGMQQHASILNDKRARGW